MIIIPSNVNALNLPKGSIRFPCPSTVIVPTSPSAFNFAADFTVELWLYPVNYPGMAVITDFNADAGGFRIYPSTGNLAIRLGGTNYTTSGTTLTQNAWNHIALTRSGSTVKAFIRGSLVMTQTNSTSIASGNAIGYINAYQGGSDCGDCYISNYRIVNGTAVYTSAFTPPASPLSAISGTALLTCQSPTTLVDTSPNAWTLGSSGSYTISATSPFA